MRLSESILGTQATVLLSSSITILSTISSTMIDIDKYFSVRLGLELRASTAFSGKLRVMPSTAT